MKRTIVLLFALILLAAAPSAHAQRGTQPPTRSGYVLRSCPVSWAPMGYVQCWLPATYQPYRSGR